MSSNRRIVQTAPTSYCKDPSHYRDGVIPLTPAYHRITWLYWKYFAVGGDSYAQNGVPPGGSSSTNLYFVLNLSTKYQQESIPSLIVFHTILLCFPSLNITFSKQDSTAPEKVHTFPTKKLSLHSNFSVVVFPAFSMCRDIWHPFIPDKHAATPILHYWLGLFSAPHTELAARMSLTTTNNRISLHAKAVRLFLLVILLFLTNTYHSGILRVDALQGIPVWYPHYHFRL